MYSKIIGSTLVVASMLGAPVIAFAQNEPGQAGPTTSGPRAKAPVAHHKMNTSHMRTGTTTGMSPSGSSYGQGKARPGGSSVSSKPPGS